MGLSVEETVTKLLSSNEILLKDKIDNVFLSKPIFDLGGYLKTYKPDPSPYEGKYLFIK